MSIAAQTIERMPVGPAHRRMFWLLGSGMLIDAFDLFMQAGVLAAMVHEGFTTSAGVAHFVFATFIGLAVGSLGTGALADRIGRRALYQFNLLLFGIASLLICVTPDFDLVVCLRFVMGVGLGGELVAGYAIMSEMTPAFCRGRWGTLLGLLVNTAQPISAFVGAVVLPNVGWRWMFLIGGVPALVVWYLRRSLPESPRWLERRGRLDEMRMVLGQLWTENAPDTPMPVITGGQGGDPAGLPWTALFGRKRVARTLFCCAIMSMMLASQYGFLSWVPTLLLQHGQSIVHSLYYSAIMAIGAPLGMIVPILVLDKLGRKMTLACAAMAAGAVGIVYAYALDASPVVLIAAGLFQVFFIQIAASTIISTYVPELFPTDVRGTGLGIAVACGRVAAALMPYLVLVVLTSFGAFAVFLMLALILMALAIVVLIFGPETKGKTLEEISAMAPQTTSGSTMRRQGALERR